jgi:transposase-like protein
VLVCLRGDRSVKEVRREVRREYQISDTLSYAWRDKFLEGRGRAGGQGGPRRERELPQDAGAGAGAGQEDLRARSRGKHSEAGSEGAHRPVSRAGRARLCRRDRGARDADQPAARLSDAAAEAAAAIGDRRPIQSSRPSSRRPSPPTRGLATGHTTRSAGPGRMDSNGRHKSPSVDNSRRGTLAMAASGSE